MTDSEKINALLNILERAIHGGCTWHEGAFMVEAEEVVASVRESLKSDWRIGLPCKPKMRTHPRRYDQCRVIDVLPSGCYGMVDPNGILRIRTNRGEVFVEPSENWMTA